MATVNSQETTSCIDDTVLNKQSNSNPNVLKIKNLDYHRNCKQVFDSINEKHLLKNFLILHQNICGILRKTDEFLIPLPEISLQALCLSEHHLGIDEINKINFSPYTPRAQYCRQYYNKGGVAIFVNNNIQSNIIDLEQFSKEQDLEVCALRISLLQKSLIIICIYRSPTGNFKYFINQLEAIINKIYKAETYIIVCEDFNINHLETNNRHNQLQSLLASFNLFGTVTFPTRITNNTSTLIDNIYINISSCNYKVSPLSNGLSDHDAQIMEILNLYYVNPKKHHKLTRKMDNNTMLNFTTSLSYENWDEVFLEEEVNLIFNNFMNTYLRIFNASFPIIIGKEHINPIPG